MSIVIYHRQPFCGFSLQMGIFIDTKYFLLEILTRIVQINGFADTSMSLLCFDSVPLVHHTSLPSYSCLFLVPSTPSF